MYHYADTTDVSYSEAHRCEDHGHRGYCEVCGAPVSQDKRCLHANTVLAGVNGNVKLCTDCGAAHMV